MSAESELPSESFAVASGKPSVGEWPVGKSSMGGPSVGEPVGKSSIGGPFPGEFSVGQSIGGPSVAESVGHPVEQKGKQLPSVVSQG